MKRGHNTCIEFARCADLTVSPPRSLSATSPAKSGPHPDQSLQPAADPLRGLSAAELGRVPLANLRRAVNPAFHLGAVSS